MSQGKPAAALPLAQSAVRLAPQAFYAHWALADDNYALGHEQAEAEQDALVSGYGPQLQTSADPYLRNVWRWYQLLKDWRMGDPLGARADCDAFLATGGTGTDIDGYFMFFKAVLDGDVHDLREASGSAAGIPSQLQYWPANFHRKLAQELVGVSAGEWRGVVDLGRQLGTLAQGKTFAQPVTLVWVVPSHAIGLAHLGDVGGAETLIATTALDCDQCVRARGQIAAMRHDWHAVDHWFGMVAARSPSIPYADTDWAQRCA